MSEATKTVEMITEGKTPKLLTLIPKGQSPKLYLDLIKTQIMGVDSKGNPRPDDDLLLFLYVAKRTGLDPLNKQIYAIYRWDSRQGKDKMTIQASIDGMRVVAQRTKGYVGQDDVVFDDETKKNPGKATVTVYKQMGNQRVPFTASARWGEYVQTDSKGMPIVMWAKMPYLMLGKCAEALALRKAFPNELSGIYTPEEMSQSTNVLSDLSAPARFDKPKEIEVISGAPEDQSTKSDLNAPVQPEPAKEPEAEPKPKVILGTTEATKTKDVAAMRAALKPRTIEDLQKRALELGKEVNNEEKDKLPTQEPEQLTVESGVKENGTKKELE